MEPKKQAIIDALRAFINQRPGLEFGNYGSVSAYRSECRAIARDKREALELLRAVEWRDSITAERIIEATRAYSGRLKIIMGGHNADKSRDVMIEYCAGQYFPTEYRKAACAVLASALWDWTRDCAMPGEGTLAGIKQSKGDWLRKHFRQEFGRGIASRWFS